MGDVDAKFTKEASSSFRKSKMQMQLHMMGRMKSICNNEYQGSADTTITKRASATANIKPVQIQWLSQRHLYKQINPGYRYIRHQKSKFVIAPPISITVHHKARKRLCNPANWSRACPTKLPQECIVFSCLEAIVN